MPSLSWKRQTVNGKLQLTINATPAPREARLWIAQASTTDFRAARWSERQGSVSNGKIIGEVTPPNKEHVAFFGELDYEIDGLRYHLSTQVRMTD